MNIRTKIILGFLLVIIPASITGFFTVRELQKISGPLDTTIATSVESLSKMARLDDLSGSIRYYDEVLTMSARNYAFTGNPKWKDRYYTEAPKLDAVIKEALAIGGDQSKNFFQKINASNLALVQMEENSMKLVDDKQQAKAIALLESSDYALQKSVYQSGLNDLIQGNESAYEKAESSSFLTLNNTITAVKKNIEYDVIFINILITLCCFGFLLWGIIFANILTKPFHQLQKTALALAEGKENERSAIHSKDEIGDLARAINLMADKLTQSKTDLEKRVKERTAELEKVNGFMTGRELKMVEMKKEIAELKSKQ